jgi:hypothetical protein
MIHSLSPSGYIPERCNCQCCSAIAIELSDLSPAQRLVDICSLPGLCWGMFTSGSPEMCCALPIEVFLSRTYRVSAYSAFGEMRRKITSCINAPCPVQNECIYIPLKPSNSIDIMYYPLYASLDHFPSSSHHSTLLTITKSSPTSLLQYTLRFADRLLKQNATISATTNSTANGTPAANPILVFEG